MCNTIGLTEEEYGILMDETQYCGFMSEQLCIFIKEGLAGDHDAWIDAINLMKEEGKLYRYPHSILGRIYASFLRKLIDANSDNEEDCADWLIDLGAAYEYGVGVDPDVNEAIRCYQRVANIGWCEGNECLGTLYLFGRGVPVDYEQAFHYLTIDDNHQDIAIDYYIGEMYRQGLYIEKNEEVACRYYEKKINEDYSTNIWKMDITHWRACYRLGVAKHYGWGTEKNIEEAWRLINNAKLFRDDLLNKTDDLILLQTNNLSLDIINDVTEEELNHELELIDHEAENYR